MDCILPSYQLYFKDGSAFFGSYYVSFDRFYGIWFNGKNWIIGPVKNINEGRRLSGYLSSEDGLRCPSSSQQWKEKIDGSVSSAEATLISVKCEGQLIVIFS